MQQQPQQERTAAAAVHVPPVLDCAAASPPANAATSSTMPAVGGRSLPLYTPEDNDHLSPLVCLVRCQLELFSATPEDVRARSNVRGNIAKNITAGRVGIRCVHCAAAAARGGGGGARGGSSKGSVSYPASIRILNQAVRNWQRYHYPTCPYMPQAVRERYERLTSGRRSVSSARSQEYWVQRCYEVGLVDAGEGVGIYFEDEARQLGLTTVRQQPQSPTLFTPTQPTPPAMEKAATPGKNRETDHDSRTHRQRKSEQYGAGETASPETCETASRGTPSEPSTEATLHADSNRSGMASEEDLEDEMLADLAILMGDGDDADTAADFSGIDEIGFRSTSSSTPREQTALTFGPLAPIQPVQNSPSGDPVHISNNISSDPAIVASSIGGRGRSQQQHLLSKLQFALQIVDTLRMKHSNASVGTTHRTRMEEDLHSLGKEMFRMLTGGTHLLRHDNIDGSACPSPNDNNVDDESGRRTKRVHKSSGVVGALEDGGYPVNLCIFVKSLVDSTDHDAAGRFASIADVEEELHRMITYPERYLNDPVAKDSSGELRPPSRIYGCKIQKEKLLQAFRSVFVAREDSRGLALISGRSGSGKTSLVGILREPLLQSRGKLIAIKFDSSSQDQPISAIFRGFDAYCDQLQQGDDFEAYQSNSNAVKNALGPSSRILQSQIPCLAGLVGDLAPSLSLDLSNKEMFNSILYCLRIFVRAIAVSSSRPIVILMDDMQWADSESLDLIRAFVSDTSISPILFVGCYREEEVQGKHPLLNTLGDLSLSGVSTWNISTENLMKENVNELLADTFHLSPRITAPLAEEIYRKSRGNALFVQQLLRSLLDEHLLRYSAEARRWEWNLDTIRRKNIPDSAVGLVLERMKEYGAVVQALLKVAALLGARFDAATLKLFHSGSDGGGDGSAILPYIDMIANDGLFVLDGLSYRFAHDQLWRAAYSLTDEEDREKAHLFIGRQLLRGLNRSKNVYALEEHLHQIVDQLNRGQAQIFDKAWKLKLAELNLQAGRMSVSSCNFIQASIYMLQGCLQVSDQDWEGHYDLALQLFTACAEVQVAHGDNDGAIFAANTVLSWSRSFNDKLRAYHALILALVAKAEMDYALSHCLVVLEGLGEAFPSVADIDPTRIKTELDETTRALSTLRLEDITSRPAPSNGTTDAKMRFLVAASRITYSTSPNLLILLSLRMVKITMDNGITPESSFAFGALANVLCGMKFRDQSAFCGRVALALLNVFHDKHSQVIHLALNYSIHPYRSPAQACLDSSERAYSHGMSVGDPDWAYLNVACAVPMNIFAPNASTKLGEVRSKLEGYVQELKQYKHHMIGFVQIFLQALINFMSYPSPKQGNQNPTVLTGEIMSQENVLAMARQNLPPTDGSGGSRDVESCPYPLRTQRKIHFYRLWLAQAYRKFDTVMEMADLVHQNVASSTFYPSFELVLEIFYLGLAANAIVRRCGDSDNKWLLIANDMTKRMKVLADTECAWNFCQKYELLRAEQAYTAGKIETAIIAYDMAIQKAEEHRFINEQALASELAGLFYMEQDQLGHAREYLHLAESLYRTWGAQRKADDVQCLLREVDSIQNVANS